MNDPDDELSRLLRDAVSDVEPRGTLDQIRSRTRTHKVVPMNRRWLLPVLAAAAATVVVIGGVVTLTGGDTRKDNPPAAQEPTSPGTDDSSAATSEPADTNVERAVPIYFVGRTAVGTRLYREFQRQEVCPTPECLMEASVRGAVAGQPDDPDYRSPWPAGTKVNAVSYNGDVLTIDLSGDLHDQPSGMSADDAGMAVEQVMYSAQAALGKGRPPVQLLLDGQRSDQVLGVATSEPLAAGNPDSVLASIWISEPAEGSTVGTGFTVKGQAATFEANVVWELKQGDKVVRNGFTTAQECCTLSPYEFTVTATPGDYTLVVHDTDESDGEGVGTSQDTKQITVK
jgi:hypothetical protein